MAKKKKVDKKGKKPHKNKPTGKKYKMYTIDGDSIKRAPTCPRCGLGIFLMVSNGRQYCGKCHYTEFDSKKPIEQAEIPKA